MTKNQDEMWDILVGLSGEDVLQLLTDWHGLQLLDEGFYGHMINEGYIDEEPEDEDEEDEHIDKITKNKIKALAYIKQLKLHPNVEKDLREDDIVNVSEGFPASLFWSKDEQDDTIRELQERGSVVWHIVKGAYVLGGTDQVEMEAYLLANDEDDYELPAEGDSFEAFAYVKNLTWPECSEYGYVWVKMRNGGLVRTA